MGLQKMLKKIACGTFANAIRYKLVRMSKPVCSIATISNKSHLYPQQMRLSSRIQTISRQLSTETAIVKQDEQNRFFYIEGTKKKASLQYKLKKEVVTIKATSVAKEFAGRGYGKLLAETALSWIAQNNYRVIIECDFVDKYVRVMKPEYMKYVIQK